MKSIGQEITKKCSDLLLAAKFLASLTHSTNKEGDWLSIKGNDVWNTPESQSKLIRILRWSYDNLSSQLKRCFSYCSIFPKDWEINRETLIQPWIAEGFLDISNTTLEVNVLKVWFGVHFWRRCKGICWMTS